MTASQSPHLVQCVDATRDSEVGALVDDREQGREELRPIGRPVKARDLGHDDRKLCRHFVALVLEMHQKELFECSLRTWLGMWLRLGRKNE